MFHRLFIYTPSWPKGFPSRIVNSSREGSGHIRSGTTSVSSGITEVFGHGGLLLSIHPLLFIYCGTAIHVTEERGEVEVGGRA